MDAIIGRDEALASLLDDIERSRLVTLTGAGGSGKTRLAEAALLSLQAADREAWFVDLSSVQEHRVVATTIMATLRLEASFARDAIDVVAEALTGRDVVLVLDNVEQITDVAEPVTSLLGGIAGLRILTTSRIPLGIRGETEVAVEPLALPIGPTTEAIESSPAGRLFLTRARSIGRLRSLDDTTASDVARLLARLDGLPLAIELAAARTRAMSPAEILRRLERMGLEAIESPDASRQSSLRAVLEWTVGLLGPAERAVLEAVSVCAGFDLGLAQRLVPKLDVVHAIEALVAMGLVLPTGTVDGVSRFRLLEPVRGEVLRGLSPTTVASLQDRHANVFMDLAMRWYEAAPAGVSPETRQRMDAEADNLRRALDRLVSVDPRRALVLALHLEPFWHSHGRVGEGMDWFRRAAALSPEPSRELARASAGYLSMATGVLGPVELRALTADTIAMARRVGDQTALIDALSTRMWIAANEGDPTGVPEVEAALEAIDLADLSVRERINLLELRVDAAAAREGYDSDACIALNRGLLAEASAAGWTTFHAVASCNLAQALLGRGEREESAKLSGAAARTLRQLGQRARVGWALGYQAAALAELGRTQEAAAAIAESADIADEMRLPRTVSDTLRNAVPVATAIGDPLLAARLWACATRLVERGGADISGLDRRLASHWLEAARASASAVAIEIALREGRRADPLDLLKVLRGLTPKLPPATVPGWPGPAGLTRREVEILSLVGRGLTDPEIGRALFISPKTASVHVANIRAKLGLSSRLAAALRARELGLAELDPTPDPAPPQLPGRDR